MSDFSSTLNVIQGTIGTIPKGISDIVYISESRCCCFCGKLYQKRSQMYKYSDGNYVCVRCKAYIETKYK